MARADCGLADLRNIAPSAAVLACEVSEWSVGMQVQHCCLATSGICRSLIASTPPAPRSGFSLVTSLVLLSGRIPRGRGRSPEPAIPREGVPIDELEAMLDESEQLLAEARQVGPNAWYRHFFFGVLDRDRTLKFIGIHNRHHLRIISDILAA
jgi:hypothetical protein